MKEQTVLQCARCLTHTPLIETESQESILEAIEANKRCKHCNHYAMLCFDSRIIVTGKSWKVYYASRNKNRSREHARATVRLPIDENARPLLVRA